MKIAELLQELIEAGKKDRNALLESGVKLIRLKANPEIEMTPEVKKYFDSLETRLNSPEVLDVIGELNVRQMAYGYITSEEIHEALMKVL